MSDPTEETTEALPSVQDVMASLTGFDQIAIRKAFGMSLSEIQTVDTLQLMYALIFILKRRDGLNDGQAYQASQSLTIQQTEGFFAPVDLDEESEQGKGV